MTFKAHLEELPPKWYETKILAADMVISISGGMDGVASERELEECPYKGDTVKCASNAPDDAWEVCEGRCEAVDFSGGHYESQRVYDLARFIVDKINTEYDE